MTIATAISGTATLGVATFAVIDPSVINFAGVVVAAAVTIITVVYTYKTKALEKKVEAQDVKIAEVIKTSDGMKDALVKATASESLARGVLEGIGQAEAKAAVKAATIAEGRAQVGQVAPLTEPSPLLASQTHPVSVAKVEGVKLTPEQIDKMIQELQAQKEKSQ